MKKYIGIFLCLFAAVFFAGCGDVSLVWEKMEKFTVIGNGQQISYRPYGKKDYVLMQDNTKVLDSFVWVKTKDSEAILDFGSKGAMFMDKNTTVQVRSTERGIYIVQLSGNTYHGVNQIVGKGYYNVKTNKNLLVVKGTGFGVEDDGSNWEDEGQVIVVDEVTERHEDMSEEDVPDGPLWVLGGRTLIVIRGQRNPRQPGDANGTNAGGRNTGSQNSSFDPNLDGNTWRERARELYRRWRELEGQRRQLGDAEYQRRLLGLMNAYLTPLTDEEMKNQEVNCENIRSSMDSAYIAINKLSMSDQMVDTADFLLEELGGLDGVERFLNTVCNDNTIDSNERAYINKMRQVMGL